VHEEPGTTRDSVDVYCETDNEVFLFTDTAGIRHKRKVKEAADIYGIYRAEDSIQRSDICVIMIDAREGLARDDIRLIKMAEEKGRGMIIAVNKWDLLKGVEMGLYEKTIRERLRAVRNIPILFTSCKTGLNTAEILPLVKLVFDNFKAEFSQAELDEMLEYINADGRFPIARFGIHARIKSIRQIKTSPPVFSIRLPCTGDIKREISAMLENCLSNELGLSGVPIKFEVEGKRNVVKRRKAGKKFKR